MFMPAYQLHVRPLGFNILHRCGRLFQEYCVDKFAQIEQERLAYFRTTCFKKRVENRRNIEEAAANGTDLSNVGTKVLLPSSFSGGPRQMWQLYHDAMGIVRYCGKPDLSDIISKGLSLKLMKPYNPGMYILLLVFLLLLIKILSYTL